MPYNWLVFVDFKKKATIRQHVSMGPPMYNFLDCVLKGDAKAKFSLTVNVGGKSIVEYYKEVMNQVMAHMFPTYAYRD